MHLVGYGRCQQFKIRCDRDVSVQKNRFNFLIQTSVKQEFLHGYIELNKVSFKVIAKSYLE